ncbi:MAG: hypothetical protein K6T74_04500 [Geminicoccaceae bacterium]|nr:hypothetical protein [Geminicoccaceae bacterium]
MRRIRILESLARLEREELDRRRRELANLEDRLAAVRTCARQLRDAMPSEIVAGWNLAGGPAPLGRWLAAAHERDRTLRSETETLEAQRERAIAEVEARYAAKRRGELILARARGELRAREVEREQRQLDELAVLRRAREVDRSP